MSIVNYIVKSFTPSHDTSDVSVNTSIVIEFSEPMNRSTLNEKTVILSSDKGIVPAQYDYNGMNRTLKVTPLEPLNEGTYYNLRLLNGEDGLKSAFGDLSNREFSLYFKTEEAPLVEPEKPGTPEEAPNPPIEDTTTPEDPIDSSTDLFLLDSYPGSNGIYKAENPIVLLFSKSIDSKALSSNVFLKERSIHHLLESLSKGNSLSKDSFISLTVETEGKTDRHVLKPIADLKSGTEYELVIKDSISEDMFGDIRIPFQTNWSELYTTVEDVRLALGSFSEAFTDAELLRLIHQQSISVYQLISMRDGFNEDDWNGKFPYAAGQYVLYKTAYQSMLGQIIESSSGMRQSFTLADLSVSNSETTSSEISKLIGLLKDEVDKWWDILNGKSEEEMEGKTLFLRKGASATRGGESNPNPEFITRVPFKELGEE